MSARAGGEGDGLPGRERSLQALLESLRPTAVGRRFGLQRITSLADLRAHLPLLDPAEHGRQVEAQLGFGPVDPRDPAAMARAGITAERPEVTRVWGLFAGPWIRRATPTPGIPGIPAVVLQAREVERAVDGILEGDLAALGATVTRIDRADDPSALLGALAAGAPMIVALPSVATITWLEGHVGGPLEGALPSLRLLLASHDLGWRARTRVPIESAGWIHRAGRLGLPSSRAPARAFTLAVGSQIIELLPHRELDHEGALHLEGATILPEEAILGWRYELVVSSPLGYLRLRTGAHVEVVGFDPPTACAPFPRPRVVRLRPPPPSVALEGVSLPGAWLTAAVRQALRPEEPALVAATVGPDPSAVDPRASRRGDDRRVAGDPFADTELGGSRAASRARPLQPRRLLIQLEVQGLGRHDFARQVAARVDGDLRRRSPAYEHLRGLGELRMPGVVVVEPGSFAAARARRIQALRGGVDAPIVRVVGRERASIFPSSTRY